VVRPGWGARHPDIAALLARSTPVLEIDAEWPASGPMRVGAHVGAEDLPRDCVTSVRVIVVVGDAIVVATNPGGSHPWPGGRLEPGESWLDAAVREVHEETGWHLDRDTVRVLGWLHLENLEPRPDDHPYPHPDFLQYVVTGRASTRDGDDATWVDMADGYEQSSRLVPMAELATVDFQDPLCGPFFALL
jgi:ADP-ribose pyrophosphatase YjhB (NUDIX family)